jgi:hypothetical protein
MLQQRACIKQKSIARCLQPQSETGREKIDETANIRLLQLQVRIYGVDTGVCDVISWSGNNRTCRPAVNSSSTRKLDKAAIPAPSSNSESTALPLLVLIRPFTSTVLLCLFY